MPPKETATAGTGDLVAGMQQISIGTIRGQPETLDGCPPRPGYGTSGREIKVNANMFLTRFKGPGLSINHYDIDINPVVKVANQKKPRPLMQKIWDQMVREAKGDIKKCLDAAAYDQVKSFYSPYDIPMTNGKCEIVISLIEDGVEAKDDKRRFKAVIQHAQVVDLDTIIDYCHGNRQTEQAKNMMLVAIQAMNVLFRQDPAQRFTMSGAAGRRFFTEDGAVPLSGGAILYRGFQQSFRWTSANYPAVKLDTAYSAFFVPGMLPDVAAQLLGMGGGGGGFRGADRGRGGNRGRGSDHGRGDFQGGRGGFQGGGGSGGASLQELNSSQIRKLNDLLRGAKFKVTHRTTERVFTIKGISQQPADAIKFLLNGKNGAADRQISVPQYFKEVYNTLVTRPRLPCVQYGPKNFIPLEFVKLEPFNSVPFLRITAEQTAEISTGLWYRKQFSIIKQAARPPPERRQAIMAWRQTLNYDNLKKVQAWGVQVQQNMMPISARVLQPPNVLYAQNKSVRATYGAWNTRGVKFTKPGRPLKSWAVVNFDSRCDNDAIKQFITGFVKVLTEYGCPVENRQPALVTGDQRTIKESLQNGAREAYLSAAKQDPQLLIVIMPRKDTALYASIKANAAEHLNKPVVTQCLQSNKVTNDRGRDQYLGNVAMKVHAKLGGITHHVQHGIEKSTMMIGADVSHPPPKGGPIPPSIAVTIAAVNGDNNQFIPAMRLQEGRVEIIQDLEGMVHSHLLQFEKRTRTKPERILMFRDGVSEGQYAHCVNQELPAIKRAAAKFGPAYKPKVTFVICAKRHSMRFFAQNGQDMDKTGNLPPGTVVDRDVTSPFGFDFYLQAHAGLQGTAKPTHYVVVADENKYTADKMQALVNNLCYSYARATRSVSLVPVAYYADIIAEKARAWVYTEDTSETGTVTSINSGSRRESLTFDPLRMKKRLEDSPAFNEVAWYM